MKNIGEKLTTVKEKAKIQGKRWFLLSYLGMITIFFVGCSLLLSFFPVAIGTIPVGAFFLALSINLIKAIYILFIILGFIFGRVLKKRSLYLAKGFTYGSITIIVLSVLFYVLVIL